MRTPPPFARSLPCRRDAEVLASARTGTLAGELAAHATDCRRCAEALAAEALLRALAEAVGPPARLPDPGLLLLQAREARRASAARRALRPLRAARVAATAVGAGSLVALAPLLRVDVVGGLATIGDAFGTLTKGAVDASAQALSRPLGDPGLLLLATLLLAALVAALMLAWEHA